MANIARRSFQYGTEKIVVEFDSIRIHKTDNDMARLNLVGYPSRDEKLCAAIRKHFLRWKRFDELEREFPKLDIE